MKKLPIGSLFGMFLVLAAGFALTPQASLAGQGGDNPFKALKDLLGNLKAGQKGAGQQEASKARIALRGKWEADKASCYRPTDTLVYAEDGLWSGYEWHCQVPESAYNATGFSGLLACSAEGEDYDNQLTVALEAGGQSLVVNPDGHGRGQKLLKCPAETETIKY